MKKLIETITLDTFTTSYGIFTAYRTAHSTAHTWLSSDMAHTLDIEYYLAHSGDKYLSPFYENLEALVEAQESGSVTAFITDVIFTKYSTKWNNIYKALEVNNYNPLIDYSEVSIRTPNITRSNDTKTNSDYSVTLSGTQDGSIFGYNSITAVPAQAIENSQTSRTQGDEQNNYVQSTQSETGTETTSRNGIRTRTQQELIEEEINVRKRILTDIMMNDVDSIVCCLVYSN